VAEFIPETTMGRHIVLALLVFVGVIATTSGAIFGTDTEVLLNMMKYAGKGCIRISSIFGLFSCRVMAEFGQSRGCDTCSPNVGIDGIVLICFFFFFFSFVVETRGILVL
jgi:hypothetical protein